MSRIDELQKKYPNIHRDVIIKWELMNLGVRDSAALDKGGYWMNAVRDYASRDHDATLAQAVKDRPDRVRPGWVKHPSAMFLKSGLGAMTNRSSRSPYEVRIEQDDRYGLYEGEQRTAEVWFPGAAVGEPGSEDFWPGDRLAGRNRNCRVDGRGANDPVMPQSQHCGYFTTGDQCRFCGYNKQHDDNRTLVRPPKSTLDDMLDAYRKRAAEHKIIELRVGTDGAVSDPASRHKLNDYYLRFIEKIASATPTYKPVITFHSMPMSREQLQRLKDAGVDCVCSQMEVWDPRLFMEIVPGKAKQFGHEGYKEHQLNVVDIFGRGNANCNFVVGVTLMPQNGHQTWQEARDVELEGMRWLTKNGIFPGFQCFRPMPGSAYGDDKSLQSKIPIPTELILELALGLHQAMLEYDLYGHYNKFMMCPLCLHTSEYLADIGMFELADGPAKYVASEIPDEINWLAKFVAKVGSTPEA